MYCSEKGGTRYENRSFRKHFSFVLCEPVLSEIKKLLKNKFSLTVGEIAFFVSLLSEAADEEYNPTGVLSGVCRDPDDDLILLCAAETKADFLVTGDNDLLVLKEYQKTKIIRPRDFELLFGD